MPQCPIVGNTSGNNITSIGKSIGVKVSPILFPKVSVMVSAILLAQSIGIVIGSTICKYHYQARWVTSASAHDRQGSVNIAKNWLVSLGWSEIVGSYDTEDTLAEIGSRKYILNEMKWLWIWLYVCICLQTSCRVMKPTLKGLLRLFVALYCQTHAWNKIQ